VYRLAGAARTDHRAAIRGRSSRKPIRAVAMLTATPVSVSTKRRIGFSHASARTLRSRMAILACAPGRPGEAVAASRYCVPSGAGNLAGQAEVHLYLQASPGPGPGGQRGPVRSSWPPRAADAEEFLRRAVRAAGDLGCL
jgi:hypothetical protein